MTSASRAASGTVTRLGDDQIHTLIVGAGPSGLATAHKLAQAGIVPLIVEQSATAGGLMRSIVRGDFRMDIGRKELYTRIPEVDRLWRAILGADYRRYPHRVGSLYRGRILEMSDRYRGARRGLPWPWLICGSIDLLLCWVGTGLSRPSNYQDYWYRRAGRRFARLFAQGYWEKFRGQAWADMPVPDTEIDGRDVNSYAFNAIRQGLKLASQGGPSVQEDWHHPAKGSGQIADLMQDQIMCRGAHIHFNSKVVEMRSVAGAIDQVLIQDAHGVRACRPRHVVSSMQIEDLVGVLDDPTQPGESKSFRMPVDSEQSVILVYLFLDQAPRFPHAWLEVNDADVKAGRITNFAAFNGDMVPPHKTCLCVEFFCAGKDPLLQFSPKQLVDLAIRECAENQLIDPEKLLDTLVTSMKRTNAAASWRDWQKAFKLKLLEDVRQFKNLYHVNRPGMDWATFAGLMAAEAILQGCRNEFDRRADPTRRYSADRQALAATSAPA